MAVKILLFIPRVLCVAACAAIVVLAAPILGLLGREGATPSTPEHPHASGRTEES